MEEVEMRYFFFEGTCFKYSNFQMKKILRVGTLLSFDIKQKKKEKSFKAVHAIWAASLLHKSMCYTANYANIVVLLVIETQFKIWFKLYNFFFCLYLQQR